MRSDRTTRILILGGGFGGLYAAMHLEKTLGGQHRDHPDQPGQLLVWP
jgi:NADH dehydrogenase FAD-containing subunit